MFQNSECAGGVTITAVSGDKPIITSTGTGVTLQNRNIVGTGEFIQGTFIQLTGADNKLTNSVIDFSGAKITNSSSFHTVYLGGNNAEVSNSQISAGESVQSSSQCIVIQNASGISGVKITGNTLTLGKSVKYKSDGAEVSSGSIGVRIASGVTDITLEGNTITCQITDTSMNDGIAVDGVDKAIP